MVVVRGRGGSQILETGGDRRIARLLGIDPSTVASGRRQLIERDVEVDRVRRTGGGRRPTEKKHRKSSPASKP